MKLEPLIAKVCTESTRSAVFELFAATARIYKQVITRLNTSIKSFTLSVNGRELLAQNSQSICWCLAEPLLVSTPTDSFVCMSSRTTLC